MNDYMSKWEKAEKDMVKSLISDEMLGEEVLEAQQKKLDESLWDRYEPEINVAAKFEKIERALSGEPWPTKPELPVITKDDGNLMWCDAQEEQLPDIRQSDAPKMPHSEELFALKILAGMRNNSISASISTMQERINQLDMQIDSLKQIKTDMNTELEFMRRLKYADSVKYDYGF